MNATRTGKALQLAYSEVQDKVFNDPHRYVVLAKGRRLGGTRGIAQWLVEQMLNGNHKVLWVDTIQQNISLYYARYFQPLVSQLDQSLWDWNEQKKVLKICTSYLDMRSSEKPENIEGFGYTLIVCNEAGHIFNGRRNLWENTIAPMCIDYSPKVFFIGTPKGKTDKKGQPHLFYEFWCRDEDKKTFPDWVSYKYSTYFNPFLTKAAIQEYEATIPYNIRQQEIYGEFIDTDGNVIFKHEWWHTGDAVPFGTINRIMSLDTAYKTGAENDYSACTVWEKTAKEYWCTDCWNERLTFPDLIDKVIATYKANNSDLILIEDAASGQSLFQSLQAQGLPVSAYKIDRDKIARATACTPLIEQGSVYLRKGEWNKMLTDQCESFPLGEYDDIVDTVSQALNYLKSYAFGELRPIVSKKVVRSSELTAHFD